MDSINWGKASAKSPPINKGELELQKLMDNLELILPLINGTHNNQILIEAK